MKYLSLLSVVLFMICVIAAIATHEWYGAMGFFTGVGWAFISFLNELENESKSGSITDNN